MRILITGATSGIGKQLALDYHSEGNKVLAVGRNENQLQELANTGIQTGRVDLSDREASLAWFQSQNAVDLAILNAGTCEYLDMPNFDSESFIRVMRANVETMAICIEGVIPLLKKGDNPHLVGVGSSAAYVPLPRAEAYGSSKAAVDYLMKTLRITLQPFGIDVSLVCPGFVKTPLTDLNDFPMPFLLSVEEASRYMRRGINKRRAEIHFPGRLTLPMKLLSLLPTALWTTIARRMIRV